MPPSIEGQPRGIPSSPKDRPRGVPGDPHNMPSGPKDRARGFRPQDMSSAASMDAAGRLQQHSCTFMHVRHHPLTLLLGAGC